MIDFQSMSEWYINYFRGVSRGVSGGVSRGVRRGISVRARPAHIPDIALAGKNPMSVALTERYHKSQDNYLLGEKNLENSTK